MRRLGKFVRNVLVLNRTLLIAVRYHSIMMRSFRWFVRGAVVLAALAPLAGFAQFKTGEELVKKEAEFTVEVREEILSGVTDILKTRAFVPGLDFNRWDELLEKNKEDLLKIGTENGFTSGVNRLIREFGISHVGLRTPRSATFRRTGVTSGLGMGAQFENGAMVIRTVSEGSPADKAGLVVGDRIVEINGEPVKEDSRLAQNGDEPLKLKFVRGQESPRLVEVKSGEFVVVNRDKLTWVGDDIAVLRINSFSRGYEVEDINKMMTEAAKAKGVIIDLRNNGGGAVSNLAHLMGLFIESTEPVGTFVNRQMMRAFTEEKKVEMADVKEIATWGQQKYRPRTPSVPRFEGKVAVLINRGSASASEIFASAIKEVRGGEVVGQNSRGAVLASTYGRLAGGFEIQYPVSDYVTIKGQRLEGDPVVPTIPIEVVRGAEGDPVLDAAVNALRGNSPIPGSLF